MTRALELPVAVARYATPRDRSRPTLGPAVGRVMRLGGTAPLPWQAELLDVAMELRPDGQLAYSHVLVTVPRQQGKTTLLRAVAAHRLLYRRDQLVLGTAQDRPMAMRTWAYTVDLFQRRELAALQPRARRTTGLESLKLGATGGEYVIAAPTEKAGHGMSLDLGMVDEAWALTDQRLAQAFEPATIARPGSQLWIVSTAGTAESVYLRHWLELGREDAHPGLAFLEFSAGDDEDPNDPATWARCNPSLGYSVPLEALEDVHRSLTPAEWERAHLNRWVYATDYALPPSWWAACADPAMELPAVPGQLQLALDVNVDRSGASFAMAGWLDAERVGAELVDVRQGTSWIVGRARELVQRWRPFGGLILDPMGPGGALAGELEAAGVQLQLVNARAVVDAAGSLHDALSSRTFVHRGQPELDAAAAAAVRRQLLDRWAFTRRGSGGDIAPLVAVSLAHLWTRNRPPRTGPLVHFLA